jgi:thiol-disulfide isomerase/thioredoxin
MKNFLSGRPIAQILAGLGLILTGAAALAILPAAGGSRSTGVEFTAAPAQVRFEAPELTLTDLAGAPHSLSDFRGQVVLVNLWATWCPPCRAEMPVLQEYFERQRDRGFVIIAIDDGDPLPEVRAFVQEYGLSFSVWLDPTYEATERAFKTRALPSSYVIDREGTVRLAWAGAITAGNLDRFVTPLIKE